MRLKVSCPESARVSGFSTAELELELLDRAHERTTLKMDHALVCWTNLAQRFQRQLNELAKLRAKVAAEKGQGEDES